MRSFPQGIITYVYWNDGEPLLIVPEAPKRGEYPEHKHVVHGPIKARRSPRAVGGESEPLEPNYHLYTRRVDDGRWELRVGTQIPTAELNVDKLEACADNSKNKWGNSFTGTSEQVNAQTPQQYEALYTAVGADATTKISMRQANEKVNGEDRILHCKECVGVAELLEAEGCKTISEDKEEMMVQLDDGRKFTVLTSSTTYRDRWTVKTYIDGADEQEELMRGQVACVVFCIVFPDNDLITYRRGGRSNWQTFSVAPPRGGRLYCAVDGYLSEASRKALRLIDFPKPLLYWGLCRANGMELGEDWLDTNMPRGTWQGNDELFGAFRDGVCGPDVLRRKVLEIGARSADKLQLASPCAFKVEEFCAVLALDDDVDEALLKKVREAVSGLGASVDDEGDAKMDDGFSSYLGSDERKAWAGEEDDADSMDDAPADALAPPADLDAARNVQGDGGAARENSASVPAAPALGAPPNLGGVAGRPIPPAASFDDGVDPIGPTFLTPMLRALPNAPRKPQGPRGYRPQNDADAPIKRLTFSDSEDSDTW